MAYTKDDIEKILRGEATFSYRGISTQPKYSAQDMDQVLNGSATFSYSGIAPKQNLIPEVKKPGAVSTAVPGVAARQSFHMPLRTDVDMEKARQTAMGAAQAAKNLRNVKTVPVPSAQSVLKEHQDSMLSPAQIAAREQRLSVTREAITRERAEEERKRRMEAALRAAQITVPTRPAGPELPRELAYAPGGNNLLHPYDVKNERNNMRLNEFLNPARKLTREEIAEANRMIDGFYNRYVIGKINVNPEIQLSPEVQTQFDKIRALAAKASAGTAGVTGAQSAFGGEWMEQAKTKNIVSALRENPNRPDAEQLRSQLTGLTEYAGAQTQHPVAYMVGRTAGEGVKYAVGSRVITSIPGVSSGVAAAGKQLSDMVGGKVSAEVMARLLSGRVTDLPFDVINAAMETDNAEDFAKNLGVNTALGLAADATFELIGAAWRAIRNGMRSGAVRAEAPDAAEMRKIMAEEFNGDHAIRETFEPQMRDLPKAEQKARFMEQVNDVMRGEHMRSPLVVGETPDALKRFGATDIPMTMDPDTVRKIAYPEGYMGGRHNLGFYALEHLGDQLENPVAVLKSATQKDSLVIFTEFLDASGNPVMVPVHLDKAGRIGVSNEVASMYGRGDFDQFISRQRELGNILFEDEKRTLQQLPASGLQLPRVEAASDPIYSIPHSARKSNTNLLDELAVKPKELSPDDPIVRSINEAYGLHGESASAAPLKTSTSRANTSAPEPEIPKGFKERGYAESIRTKTDLPDELKNEFVSNPEIYKELSNRTTLERAETIMSEGIESARNQFDALLSQKNPAAVPLGDMLAREYMNDGNRDAAVEILRQLSEKLTESGQFSQAAAINLLKNDPATALRYLQRQIDSMNTEGVKKFRNWDNFKLTAAEIDRFGGIAPGDTEALKDIFNEIGKRVAKEYPATAKEKLIEFSHVMMLLNPKTQSRNFLANVAMLPMQKISEKVSAVGQGAVHLVNPDFKPDQAFFVSKESKDIAREVYGTVKDQLGQNVTTKWENVALKGIQERDIFKIGKHSPTALLNKFLPPEKQLEHSMMENVRQFTYKLLDWGDEPFVKKNFVDRLGSFIEARGIKNVADVPPEAISTATSEAMKATFKDDNALVRSIIYVKRNSGLVGETLMPFTKTPANITMRAIDYSPAGLATSWRNYVKNGRDAHLLIDNISKGITGTGLIWLGSLLARAGIITGKLSDNKREAAFQRQQGMQAYSIRLSDGTYISYDWAQPTATPLLIGAVISDEIEKEQKAGDFNLLEDLPELTWKALTASGDAILNQSVLQNIQDIMGGYGSPTENFVNEFLELPQRLIPSAFGATARVGDNTVRQTYSNGDMLGTQFNRMRAKIPGMSEGLPATYDTWGHEIERSQSTPGRLVQQFVAPWNTGSSGKTPLDNEIMRLYQSIGEESVFPPKAEWSITYDNQTKKLNNEEYSRYQKQLGEKSYEIVGGLFDEQAYREADDKGRAKMLQDAYEYANALAKMDMVGYKPKGWIPKAMEAENRGIPADTYIAYKNAFNNMEGYEKPDGSYVSQQDQQARMLLDDVTLKKRQKDLLSELMISDVTVIPRETRRDYSSPEALAISEMPATAQKLWAVPSVQKAVGSVENYEKVQKILAETGSDKDEYGNAISGTAKPKAVREITRKLNVTSKKAEEIYNEVAVNKHSLGELSTNQRKAYEGLHTKYNLSEGRFLDCLNRAGITEGTKDRNGKTVSGSLKQNRYRALREMGLNDQAAKVFLSEVYGYKW